VGDSVPDAAWVADDILLLLSVGLFDPSSEAPM